MEPVPNQHQETIRLGNEALSKLDALLGSLGVARGRGKWDIVGNNNPIFTWRKRKTIGESEKLAEDAKNAVEVFRAALDSDGVAMLNTEAFLDDTKSIDYFLGSIGGIIVQKKINANIKEVQKTRDAVSDALRLLDGLDKAPNRSCRVNY